MPNDTKKRKKLVPIVITVVFVAFLGIFLATIILPLIGEIYGEFLAVGFLLIYGGLIVAAIAGIIIALRQRLKEIEGGEEEDARKY